jgi:arylsulfatase A-like enzyme
MTTVLRGRWPAGKAVEVAPAVSIAILKAGTSMVFHCSSVGYVPGGKLPGDLRYKIATLLLATAALVLATDAGNVATGAEKPGAPNIIFILADDLGYGDVGCYGQRAIQTPAIDRMAAEGMRFNDFYAGCTVCAPSRCTLMTGLHTGHARIRGNALVPLAPEDLTVAELLRRAGYATGLVGKWGLGEEGSTGIPNRKGFQEFFGYLSQVHAHNYYPAFLWRDQEKVPLRNVVRQVGRSELGGVATTRLDYSHDLFAAEALAFIDRHAQTPFFLYLAFTIPHANDEARDEGMEVPDFGPYAQQPWPRPEKGKAAMITRMDRDIGRLLARLKERGIDDRTIVFFTSDNGPHREGGVDPDFFHSSGPLRGCKRSLHDGGIRMPMIVRWPGKVRGGSTSALAAAFWDFLPTAAALAGTASPAGIDGISFLPTLLEKGRQPEHEFLYWEFHEGDSQQAVRMGSWKAVRPRPGAALELYDLRTDVGEGHDVAAGQPAVVARIEAYLKNARTQSDVWKLAVRTGRGGKKAPAKAGNP